MLLASALSWALLAAMPVVNAHVTSGHWTTLCTLSGFKWVNLDQDVQAQRPNHPCLFAHFSNLHQAVHTPAYIELRQYLPRRIQYISFFAIERHRRPLYRAPPLFA
ncbi:hypothetical protein M1D72_01280 [Vibrio sp. AK197]